MITSQSDQTRRIIVISGGTGKTAEQVLRAALAQFRGETPEIEYQLKVRSAHAAVNMIHDAADHHALVCHSIVDPKVRCAVDEEAAKLGVPCIDVLGPAVSLLADHLRVEPRGHAGLLYEIHREQLDRIDAVDFTLAHDDGKRMRELGQADVVLVGASRTSKSVTCFYLAARGIRAANVPILPSQELPRPLCKLSPKRVFGLTMNAAHLQSIRQTRLDRISHRHVPNYADLGDIRAELRHFRELVTRKDWHCIDVSYKATEEVADQIIEWMPKRRSRTRRKETTPKRIVNHSPMRDPAVCRSDRDW